MLGLQYEPNRRRRHEKIGERSIWSAQWDAMKLMLSKAGSFVAYFLLIGYLVVMLGVVASIGLFLLGVMVNVWTVGLAIAGGVVALALINIPESTAQRFAAIVHNMQVMAWGALIVLFGLTCAWVLGGVLGPIP